MDISDRNRPFLPFNGISDSLHSRKRIVCYNNKTFINIIQ